MFPPSTTTICPMMYELKHTPQLEKPLPVPGIAYAAAHKKWPQCRFCQKSGGDIIRKFARACRAVHFAELIRPDDVNLLAHKRRQGQQVVQVPRAEQIILVALKLILAIRAQPHRSAHKELRNARAGRAKCGAAFSFYKD